MLKTPIFWTDTTQANERLAGSIILYDGDPYYVLDAHTADDGKARVNIQSCGPNKETSRKYLDAAKFNRFRDLPQVGWINPSDGGQAQFLERSARRTRTHGLADSNVSRSRFHMDGRLVREGDDRRPLTSIMDDEGFLQCVRGTYPSLTKILSNIGEKQAIAYSRMYCVYRDDIGLRWLYRGTDKIGIFTGANTLNLVSKYAYFREEIMEDPKFTLDKIQEF